MFTFMLIVILIFTTTVTGLALFEMPYLVMNEQQSDKIPEKIGAFEAFLSPVLTSVNYQHDRTPLLQRNTGNWQERNSGINPAGLL